MIEGRDFSNLFGRLFSLNKLCVYPVGSATEAVDFVRLRGKTGTKPRSLGRGYAPSTSAPPSQHLYSLASDIQSPNKGKNWRLDWVPLGRWRLSHRSRRGVSEAAATASRRQTKSSPRPVRRCSDKDCPAGLFLLADRPGPGGLKGRGALDEPRRRKHYRPHRGRSASFGRPEVFRDHENLRFSDDSESRESRAPRDFWIPQSLSEHYPPVGLDHVASTVEKG